MAAPRWRKGLELAKKSGRGRVTDWNVGNALGHLAGMRRTVHTLANPSTENQIDFGLATMNAAYYCEVALKTLIAAFGEQPLRTHDLGKLFRQAERCYGPELGEDVKTEIRRLQGGKSEGDPGWHHADPAEVAKAAGSYFEEARYAFSSPGDWGEPRLAPMHVFATADAIAAIAQRRVGSCPTPLGGETRTRG